MHATNNLKKQAYEELEMCCETMCHKPTVYEYVQYLEHTIEILQKELYNGPNISTKP